MVILPTYNERENITKLIPEIWKCLNSNNGLNHILVVDDNSPDGTADAVFKLTQSIGNLYLVRRDRKMGLGSAYLDGFRWGLQNLKPDIFVQMDADFSHPPSLLHQLTSSASRSFDIVIASRYVDGGGVTNWPWHRKILSRGANTLARLILALDVKDVTSGYRALSRRAVEILLTMTIRNEGYAYLLESLYLLSKRHLKIKEIPLIFENRRSGKTKLSILDTVRYVVNLMRLVAFRRDYALSHQ